MGGHSERARYSKKEKKGRGMTEPMTDGYYTYWSIPLLYNGAPLGRYVHPYNFDYVVEQDARDNNRNPANYSFAVADIKDFKEGEYRNNADEWYRRNVRAFEGAVIAIKRAANTQLSAGETTTRDKMLANYSALSTSITNLRASNAGWRTILETPWTPPSI